MDTSLWIAIANFLAFSQPTRLLMNTAWRSQSFQNSPLFHSVCRISSVLESSLLTSSSGDISLCKVLPRFPDVSLKTLTRSTNLGLFYRQRLTSNTNIQWKSNCNCVVVGGMQPPDSFLLWLFCLRNMKLWLHCFYQVYTTMSIEFVEYKYNMYALWTWTTVSNGGVAMYEGVFASI
jgi:hypothetical protein